jgi:hypothetical protein
MSALVIRYFTKTPEKEKKELLLTHPCHVHRRGRKSINPDDTSIRRMPMLLCIETPFKDYRASKHIKNLQNFLPNHNSFLYTSYKEIKNHPISRHMHVKSSCSGPSPFSQPYNIHPDAAIHMKCRATFISPSRSSKSQSHTLKP